MKKRLLAAIVAVLVLSTVFLGGCGSQGGNTAAVTLNVLCWGDYIKEEVVDAFENKYGIRINYVSASSNE
jgi:spermidine/putrescine transport system permease protein